MKKVVDPSAMKVGVQLGKVTKNGGVIIKCGGQEDAKKVKDTIEKELKNKYVIEDPKKIKPRIRVVGIPQDQSIENLCEVIINQNKIDNDEQKSLKIIYTSPIKNNEYYVKVEGDMHVIKSLLQKENISVGWNRCRVFEELGIIRCFNCNKYGHLSKFCTNDNSCPKCAGDHKIKECKAEISKCSNCLSVNKNLNLNLEIDHAVWDKNCKCYKRITERRRNAMDLNM